MTVYFLLIIYTLLCPVVASGFARDEGEKRKIIVIMSVDALFLICALKSSSVGIDIPGYKLAYEQAGRYGWFDTSYIYYEEGYVLLEKLFNTLGFSFQVYMVVMYAVIFIPVGLFIYRYSENITLSCIVYICYQTLVFNLSGIRQSIAMSICLLAYMLLDKRRIKADIGFFLLVLLAMQIHRSAFIFFPVYIIRRVKFNFVFIGGTVLAFACAILFRSNIVAYVNMYTGKYQAAETMTLGGNFAFLLGILLISIFLYFRYNLQDDYEEENDTNHMLCDDSFKKYAGIENGEVRESTIKMLTATVVLQLVLNGSSALRAANYYAIFMIICIPGLLDYFDEKSKPIYYCTITAFMVILFYVTSLAINQFNCVPYTFFWE